MNMRKTLFLVVIVASLNMGTVLAMPYDYQTPEPIESLEVYFPGTGQMWREITITTHICDARFNPDCIYGHRRAMLSTDYTVAIYHIEQESGALSLIESYSDTTPRWGYDAIPVLLDGKYQSNQQYKIIVQTGNATETDSFWTHQRTY